MAKTFKKVVHYLSDGQFHSGEQLGEDLGITRSAIWKSVKQMRKLGIEIEAKTKKGYRIPNGLDLLDLKKIKQYITKKDLKTIESIEIFDQIGSTNDYLKKQVLEHAGCVRVCLAEQQNRGKGRLGRKWLSPFGVNVYFSMLYPFTGDISALVGLSLVVATVVVDVLSELSLKEHIGIRWPNDILWRNKKLGGILVEVLGEAHGLNQAVIGIGVNVNMTKSVAKSIDQPWASIREIDEKAADKNKMIGLLINKLMESLELFQEEGFSAFYEHFNELDVLMDQLVEIETASGRMKGFGGGIDHQGRLIIRDQSSEQYVFSAGDVSVRRQMTED
jgi:BirA family biotin operon repressor/biotin-[acetyl-CoA-carboxylase] ligase